MKYLLGLYLLKIFKRLLKYHKIQKFGIKVNFTKFYITKWKCRQIWRILHDNYKTNTNYHLCLNRA